MKKKVRLLVLLIAALAMNCATGSSDGRASDGMPKFVRETRLRYQTEDSIVGIGTAKMSSTDMSMAFSESRARAQISRSLDAVVKDMIDDFRKSSESMPIATTSFQQEITQILSQSKLQGAQVVEQDKDTKGNWWTVVVLSRSGAAREINRAVSDAKLKYAEMAAFDAEARMNDAFDREAARDNGYADRD